MKYNPEKQCFVNDDGSKMTHYVSLVTRFPLPCMFWRYEGPHDETSKCYEAHMRYKRYLSRELNKAIK